MKQGRKFTAERIFYFLLGIYLVAGLLNLAVLPIAWTDEVMNLDPALQWHKHRGYTGFLWPNHGADKIFLAYPPLIQWFHIAWLYLVPFDIYWVRLPFLMLHVLAVWMIFQAIRNMGAHAWLSLLLTSLFMLDKVVFEISRSMRVEVLETFLVAALLYVLSKNKRYPLATGLLLGLLLTAHLKMWPWVLAWFILEIRNQCGWRYLLKLALTAAIPGLAFMIFIRFNFSELYSQLFSQASKHGVSEGWLQSIADHFVAGFWPVYREQPWNLLFPVIIFISALRQCITGKFRAFAPGLFLATFIVWLFVLAPHYRYWPPLYATGILVLAGEPLILKIKEKVWHRNLIWMLPLLMFGFVARHSLAVLQHNQRDLSPVKQWLTAAIDKEQKTLIIGNAAAFYISDNPKIEYGMDMYPQNLHPERYSNVYFLTNEPQLLPLISQYQVNAEKLPAFMGLFGRGDTYANLKLYKISNAAEWQQVTGRYAHDYD